MDDAPVRAPDARPGSFLSWLTVERGAYLVLALLALVLRLVNLGAYPLSDTEAGQALVAWRIYHGQPLDQTGYSPLLATLNIVSFLIAGGSDFASRLGPALLGVALVLLPAGMRRHLGRGGALIASALFAISPTATYLARRLNKVLCSRQINSTGCSPQSNQTSMSRCSSSVGEMGGKRGSSLAARTEAWSSAA